MASKTVKGLTIEIGGDTTKLGKAIKSMEDQSKKASKELTEIDAALKHIPNSEELLIQKQEALAKEIEATSGKLDILRDAEQQVQKQFEEGKVSEEQLKALQREIIITKNELEGYEKQAKETAEKLEAVSKASGKTEDSTEELGDTAKKTGADVEKLGDKTGEGAKEVKELGDNADSAGGKLSAASVAVGEFIGNLALDVLKTTIDEIKKLTEAAAEAVQETAAYGDEIDKASQKLGMSAQSYQEWNYILQHSGSDMDKMTTAAKKLADAVTDPTKDAAAAFERLGISIEDARQLSQEELFAAVITALQQMPEGAERASIANDLLGRSAQELGALLNTSVVDTEAMRQKIHELGGVMSNEAVKDAAAYQDSLQDLQTAADGITRGFAARIIPGVTSVMDVLTNVLSGKEIEPDVLVNSIEQVADALTDILTDFQDDAAKLTPVIKKLIKRELPEIAGMSGEVILELIQGVIDASPELLTAAFDIADMLAEGLTGALPDLAETLADAVTQDADVIAERLPQLIEKLCMGLVNAAPDVAQAALTLLMGLVQAIPVLAQSLAPVISELVVALVTMLVSHAPELQAGMYDLLLAILDAIPLLIEALLPIVPTILTALIDELLAHEDELGEGALEMLWTLVTALLQVGAKLALILGELLADFLGNLGDFSPKLVELINHIIDKFMQPVRGLTKKLRDSGHNIMAGLLEGITGMSGAIAQKATDIADSILQAITAPFQIHSPSRKMAWVGRMIDEGLAEGMDAYSTDPLDVMEQMVSCLLIEAAPLPAQIEGQAEPSGASMPYGISDPALLSHLDRILSAIESGHIIAIDGDKLVGETIDRIDTALNARAIAAQREG